VDIDFQARTLAFLPRDGFRPPSSKALPLTHSSSLRSIPIHIWRKETQAIVDLGNTGTLMLDREFADREKLLAGRSDSRRGRSMRH
jgi:hypothetical protein